MRRQPDDTTIRGLSFVTFQRGQFDLGNVTLRAAKMPAQLIKVAPFRVLLPLNDQLVFLNSEGAFWLETNFRPETFGNERPGKPVHRKAKVVKFA